jgi:hypothetical protein
MIENTCATMRLILVPVLVSGAIGAWSATARAEEPAATAPAAAPAAAPSGGEVARAVFARSIVQREPQDVVSSLDTDAGQIFFFTELVGMEGRTLRHRWEYDGQVMAEVSFTVGAPRWRYYSSKKLLPGQTGSWTASVVDESGAVLRSETLTRALATPEPTSPTPPAAPER